MYNRLFTNRYYMEKRQFGNIDGYEFALLREAGAVNTFVTTKGENAAQSGFSGLNLGLNSGDDCQRVLRCRTSLESAINGRAIFAEQTHGDGIVIITQDMLLLSQAELDAKLKATDALITNVAKVWLFMLTADCIPIVIFDPGKKVVAAIHAGWRGLENRIILKTIDKMVANFGCQVEQLKVGIGPAICRAHYEVGYDVSHYFIAEYSDAVMINGGKWQLDLVAICSRMLRLKGVLTENIDLSGFCSFCSPNKFYSYRRDAGNTGRMGTGIALM